jgi:hypothetical protein
MAHDRTHDPVSRAGTTSQAGICELPLHENNGQGAQTLAKFITIEKGLGPEQLC